jgi:hypothetical protein
MSYSSPYKNLPEVEKSKVQALVKTSDKLFLQSIHPERGILLYAVERLIHAIVDDLHKENITHYTPENATRLVKLINNRTALRTADQSSGPNECGGTAGASKGATSSPNQPANLPQTPKSGGTKGGKKEVRQRKTNEVN